MVMRFCDGRARRCAATAPPASVLALFRSRAAEAFAWPNAGADGFEAAGFARSVLAYEREKPRLTDGNAMDAELFAGLLALLGDAVLCTSDRVTRPPEGEGCSNRELAVAPELSPKLRRSSVSSVC